MLTSLPDENKERSRKLNNADEAINKKFGAATPEFQSAIGTPDWQESSGTTEQKAAKEKIGSTFDGTAYFLFRFT